MGELGIKISQGAIVFDTRLIDHREFLTNEKSFTFVSVGGENQTIDLKQKQRGFTLCQVPVVYTEVHCITNAVGVETVYCEQDSQFYLY